MEIDVFHYSAWPFWLLTIVGVLLTGISKSGLAGGAGVLAVPLMALYLPVPLAAAITLPLLWLMDAKTVYSYRDAIDTGLLWQLCPAACCGIAIGGLMLGKVSSEHLQWILGLLSIVFACWQSLTKFLSRFAKAGFFWGGLAGITSTLLHAGGPPLSIFLLGREVDKRQWLGTAACFFAITNLLKAIPYTLNHQWSSEQWLLSVILLPVAWFGVVLGVWLAKRIDQQLFIKIARSMLGLAGCLLIYESLF